MTVAPLATPEIDGVTLAREFGRKHGYIPRVWAEQLLPMALSRTTVDWYVSRLSVHNICIYGFRVGCDYCERPADGDATCRGCGAIL